MVGEKDTPHGRDKRIKDLDAEIKRLRGDRNDIYPVTVRIIADHPHSGLPDRDGIAELYPAVRNPVPRELTWVMTDTVNKDFFWLRAPQPVRGEKFNVECRGNDLTVTALPNVSSASVFLDARLIDFNQPVKLTVNGKKTSKKLKPSLLTLCASLQRRGDPGLAFSAELPLTVAAKKPKQ